MADHDPSAININFFGHSIRGFAAGTFVVVERETDTYSKSTGADGDTTRVRSRNKSGSITITLQAESPSNAILSGFLVADELTGTGKGPVLVTNANETANIAAGPEAWVRKPANMEYADTASNREWVIDVGRLELFNAG
jgi:hypothetical protein